jgi:hypothetical protein
MRFSPHAVPGLLALALLASLDVAAAAASADATAWRCGNAYSAEPCQGGRRVDTSDRRSQEDRHAAEASTLRMERQADAMARERRQLEHSASARSGVTVIADPRVAARKERLELQAAQRKIDRDDDARRKPRIVHDKRKKVRSAS